MKKIILYLPILMLTIWSCNQMDDVYKELDEKVEPYSNTIEYTLIAGDYSKAVGYAKKDAINKLDSTWAGYISSFQAFNDSFPGGDYIPKILPGLFPAFNKGSVAIITYNYFNDMPEDFSDYSNPTLYEFDETDYASVDDDIALTGYFFPDFNPDFYIPEVLKNSVTGAVANDIYKIAYDYSDVNPVISIATAFEEGFITGLGKFDSTSVTGSKGWYKSSYEADNYAKMSGYQQVNEDWLISNPIVLGNDASITLNFTEAIKYLNHQWDQLTVAISTDYDGDPSTATWNDFIWGDDIDTTGATIGTDYTFYTSGDIDITAYANSTIYLAFKYTSTLTNAATWEIKDVTISPIEPVYAVTFEKAPKTYNDIYHYTGSVWDKLENVFYLSSEDYTLLNVSSDRFTATTKPQDYIPKFLNVKFPLVAEGTSAIVVYNFYINSDLGTTVVSDEYTYTEGEWISSFNFISTTTEQFIYSEAGWLFDPTVKFSMASSDYDLIVQYVKNIDPTYLDSYGTQENYYGASSFRSNFDLRIASRTNIPGFTPEMTTEEALALIWARVPEAINIMLTLKYPNAVTNISGVDVHYFVTIYTYENDLARHHYTFDFQCTKSGPDPEFTQVGEKIQVD